MDLRFPAGGVPKFRTKREFGDPNTRPATIATVPLFNTGAVFIFGQISVSSLCLRCAA